MARIRTVKPSIWGDGRFKRLSRDARLLALGIISTADDAGRFIAAPVALSGTIFPHDNLKPVLVQKWRDEIAAVGMITLYSVEGCEYGILPKWRKHQKIDRPQPSSLPPPPSSNLPPEPPDNEPFGDPFDDASTNGSTQEGKGGEGIGSFPPTPASGGRSCTRHARARRGCQACETPANPTVQLGPQCGRCNPSRRLENPDGSDAGPCPDCHPSRRTA